MAHCCIVQYKLQHQTDADIHDETTASSNRPQQAFKHNSLEFPQPAPNRQKKEKKKKKKEKSSCIYSTSAPGFPLFTTSLFTMYKDLSATRTHTTTTVSAESSPLAAVKLFMQCECCCNCISIGYTQYVGFFQLTYKHLTRLFFCILFNSLSVVLMNYHFMMPGCCIVYTV